MRSRIRVLCLCAVFAVLLAIAPRRPALAEDAAPPEILEAYSIRGVVTVRTSADVPLAAYAFTTVECAPEPEAPDWTPNAAMQFDVFKMDGDYWIWVRDAAGRVSEPYAIKVRSGYSYVFRAKGLKPVPEPLAEYLERNAYSLAELNRYIAENTADAGMYTRSGVAAAAVSLAAKMAEYGVTVPWRPKGIYTCAGDWGAMADWGGLSKLVVPEGETMDSRRKHRGMHCITLMQWAYKQAGLNPIYDRNSGVFFLGSRETPKDNEIPLMAGQCGDLIKTTTYHNLMILDKVDADLDGKFDSYLVLEMISPNLTLVIYDFHQIRNYTCYDMSAYFDDTGAYRDRMLYWPGTYHIPREDWPDYLKQAEETSAKRRALQRLQFGLGLTG